MNEYFEQLFEIFDLCLEDLPVIPCYIYGFLRKSEDPTENQMKFVFNKRFRQWYLIRMADLLEKDQLMVFREQNRTPKFEKKGWNSEHPDAVWVKIQKLG